jgi:phosphate transport system permease protein
VQHNAATAAPDRRLGRPNPASGDKLFAGGVKLASLVILALLGAIIIVLLYGGLPAFRHFGARFLVTAVWNPVTDHYGALTAIFGTIVTAVLSLIMAVPLAFGIAFFLTEMAPAWLRQPIGTAVELLAAVPSIIFGMWGFFVVAPIIATVVQPFLSDTFGDVPFIGDLVFGAPYGTGIFTASLILTVMVLPFIAATMRDVFLTVPPVFKESAYGLGCTTWEVMRYIVLPYTRSAVVGGIMLGLGRALGETMAVTFVIGNANRISTSLFSPGNTIASLIALEFPEAQDGSLRLASLLALGFVLMVISLITLAISRFLLKPSAAA